MATMAICGVGVLLAGALIVVLLVNMKKGEDEARMRTAPTMVVDQEALSSPTAPPCARKWDWLGEVQYPYFWAYEFGPIAETPEHDLGSRPWIYP